MNGAYVHLLFNTLPPTISALAVGVIVFGLIWKSEAVRRTGIALLLAASLAAIPTFLSGEHAEEIVEHLDGVNAVAIEPHEDAGTFTFVLLCVQGVAVLAALIAFRGRAIPQWVVVALLVTGSVCTASALWTAKLGGRIHHPETRIVR
jgi:hypothetical protein